MKYTVSKALICTLCVLICSLAAGCKLDGSDQKTAVSYTAHNDTDRSIVSIIVNGEGGVLHAPAHDGGGEVCCVVIPDTWRPGLKVTIKWQNDGHWVRNEKGQIVVKDGQNQFVEGPWHETTVDVPKYEGGENLGRFNIHFFPNDEVKVVVSRYGPGHSSYPLR